MQRAQYCPYRRDSTAPQQLRPSNEKIPTQKSNQRHTQQIRVQHRKMQNRTAYEHLRAYKYIRILEKKRIYD